MAAENCGPGEVGVARVVVVDCDPFFDELVEVVTAKTFVDLL